MSDLDLRRQLLEFFRMNCHKDVRLTDICRAVQQPKKIVNSILYCLKNEGVLQKVVESPPVWRCRDKFCDNYNSSGAVEMMPMQYAFKDECGMSPITSVTRNKNVAVLSSVENNRSDPMYVKEQLEVYHTVVSSTTSEDLCHGSPTRHPSQKHMTVQTGGSLVSHAAYLSKPAEAILNILHKQKGSLSCRAISSLLGFPETAVKLALHQLLLLGLVHQDSYSLFWSVVDKNNTDFHDDIIANIINYLKHAKNPVHTKDLAKGVGLNYKKEINPLLYKLQQKGIVKKVNESPPMWQLGERLMDNLMETCQKQSEINFPKWDEHTYFTHALPPGECSMNSSTKPLAPTSNVQKFQNGVVKVLSPKKLTVSTHKEIAKIVDSPNEENVGESYDEQSRTLLNTANEIPDGLNKKRFQEMLVEKSAYPLPHELMKLMNSFQTSNISKITEASPCKSTSNKMPNTIAFESENSVPSACSITGQHSRPSVSESSSKSNTSRKLASSGKSSAKVPDQNSAAHYVNDVLNSDSFAALMKNPVSALYEYGQRNHIDTKVEITLSEGPPHNPRFKAVAYMGDEELAAAWDKTKKDARRQAAELAVRGLVANGGFGKFSSLTSSAETINELPPVVSEFDMIAALSHKTFNEKVLQVPEYMGGRKVLAALVMKKNSDSRGTVICLGTGNRCITGEGLSQDGLVVNDSHAEVITRRGFLRYLYKQLKTYKHGQEHPIFEAATGEPRLQVRSDITFHLYISTAPCGDGALFTHNLKPGEKVEPPDSNDSQHHPVFTKSLQGLLRSKMEAGEGTIPIDTQYRFQSWDAILRGEKLRTMSCSDKIARWNVLGLQGALLSHIIRPIYLSSVTLGNLYHHGHLSRAVCCRLVGEPDMNELLPDAFCLKHPNLGRVNVCTPSRETEKTKPHSINWCFDDERPELTSGVNGTSDERSGGHTKSRLCKAVLFQSFKEISTKFGKEHLTTITYGEAKRASKDFQAAKEILFARFQQLGRGTWIRKPEEEEEFI